MRKSNISLKIAELETRLAAPDERSLQRRYQAYMKNHPQSKMQYSHFKELHSRTQVPVSSASGKQIHARSGMSLIDKNTMQHHLKNGSFSVLSAENPHAKKASPEENAKRTAALQKDLEKMGAVYHKGKGHFFGNDENSFMVHHTHKVKPEHLENLGKKYAQHSVIHSTGGHNHLKPLHEKYAKDEMKGHGHVTGKHLKNIYTQFPNAPKVKMKLSNELTRREHYFVFEHPNGEEESVFQFNFD